MCRIVRGSRARYDRHRHGPLRHAGDSNGCDHGVSVRCARRADGTAGVDRGVGEADEEWRAGGFGGFGAGGGAVPGGDQDGGEVREGRGIVSVVPYGGQVRISTSDSAALAAVRAFLHFQRMDHGADGHDHR